VIGTALATAFATEPACANAEASVECPEGFEMRQSTSKNLAWCEGLDGMREGPFQGKRRHEPIRSAGNYHEDKKHGWWRTWDAEAELTGAKEYFFGEEVARERIAKHLEAPRRSEPRDPTHPCPNGSVVSGPAPPRSHTQWCERKREDGSYERHGPLVEIWPGGSKRRAQRFEGGIPQGTWTAWHIDGRT
jgi:hypothetical protein